MNIDDLFQLFITYGTRLIFAVLALIVGLAVIRKLSKLISFKFEKVGMDPSLRPFMLTLVTLALQVLLVISVASTVGIAMASFIAVIGALAFALGMALQGSLANFASGVLILILKPFRVGDYITTAGEGGTVKEIQVFYTLLDTPDNTRVIVPNSILSNSSMVNYSYNPTRRVDFTFGVGYGDDIDRVKEILAGIAGSQAGVFEDPPPQVVMGEHGESAVIFYLRMWCAKENYWTIYFEVLEKVKKAFDREGINIPYPQRDIHLVGSENES